MGSIGGYSEGRGSGDLVECLWVRKEWWDLMYRGFRCDG